MIPLRRAMMSATAICPVIVAWAVVNATAPQIITGGTTERNQQPTTVVAVPPMIDRPSWTADGFLSHNAWRGSSVAGADVNGDGYSDVIIGAPLYPDGITDYGVVMAYYGSPAGLSSGPPDWWLVGPVSGDQYGFTVAVAGDVNGDGFPDVAFSAGTRDGVPKRVMVAHGTATGLESSPGWVYVVDPDTLSAGEMSLSTAGDVNGDGYDDLIVGDPSEALGAGTAFLFHGSSSGLSTSPDWQFFGVADDRLGHSVSGGGDVNGDGFDDVIVGVRRLSSGEEDEGGAHMFQGSINGLSSQPEWTAESDQAGALFGHAVALLDVNDDSFADVVVGAPGFDSNSFVSNGRVFMYHGSLQGPATTANRTFDGTTSSQDLGRAVASAGDVDADGYGDLIVGFVHHASGPLQGGGAVMYHGSAAGLTALPIWEAEGNQSQSRYGHSVSSAGDVSRDGFDDVIVGAREYDDGVWLNSGMAFVYHGGPPCDATSDTDGDGVPCSEDNCPLTPNPAQDDPDGDGYGSVCDLCPEVANPDQTDGDDDGWGYACDCGDWNAAIHPGAEEINDGYDNQCEGDAGWGSVDETSPESVFTDQDTYQWPAQQGAQRYQVGRATSADFQTDCVSFVTFDPVLDDPAVPVAGTVFHYLNRPTFPNIGSWGADSAGQQREPACSGG